jgi:hypothetical protein
MAGVIFILKMEYLPRFRTDEGRPWPDTNYTLPILTKRRRRKPRHRLASLATLGSLRFRRRFPTTRLAINPARLLRLAGGYRVVAGQPSPPSTIAALSRCAGICAGL